MALFQEPLIDYSVPGVRFTRESEIGVPARVIITQLSPHDYGIIITKLVDDVLSADPPEVLSIALIGNGVNFEVYERSLMVVVYPGDLHAFSLRYQFSLTFEDDGDLWGFAFSLAQAKTMAIDRLSDLRERFRRALADVPTRRALADVPTVRVHAVAPTFADAAVATEVAGATEAVGAEAAGATDGATEA